VPWNQVDLDIFLSDPALDKLDSRLTLAFLRIVAQVHKRWPQSDWTVEPSMLRMFLGARRRSRSIEQLDAMVHAGLMLADNGVYSLAHRWRFPGPTTSVERVRRHRSLKALESAQRDHSVTTPSYGAVDSVLQNKDLAKSVTRYSIVENSDQVFPPCLDRTLSRECPNSASPARASDFFDDLDTETEPETRKRGRKDRNRDGERPDSSDFRVGQLFALWNSLPGLERHRKLNGQRPALERALREYGLENTTLAFTRYSDLRSNPAQHWTPVFSLRDLIARRSGQWMERLISDEYQTYFTKYGRDSNTLDDTYKRLKHMAAQADETKP